MSAASSHNFDETGPPPCPRCGAQMICKILNSRANPGRPYWHCVHRSRCSRFQWVPGCETALDEMVDINEPPESTLPVGIHGHLLIYVLQQISRTFTRICIILVAIFIAIL